MPLQQPVPRGRHSRAVEVVALNSRMHRAGLYPSTGAQPSGSSAHARSRFGPCRVRGRIEGVMARHVHDCYRYSEPRLAACGVCLPVVSHAVMSANIASATGFLAAQILSNETCSWVRSKPRFRTSARLKLERHVDRQGSGREVFSTS